MTQFSRIFSDHIGQSFASLERQGNLDLSTMTMTFPNQEDPLSVLIRAHELIHLRLTYSTTLGIFLDIISGLSSIKLLNILNDFDKESLSFPLFNLLKEENSLSKELLGQLAFCYLCETAISEGVKVWRPIQEGVATYIMLEQAQDKIVKETIFQKDDIEMAIKKVRENMLLHPLYYNSYKMFKNSSTILGDSNVYAAALISSDIPFYPKFDRFH